MATGFARARGTGHAWKIDGITQELLDRIRRTTERLIEEQAMRMFDEPAPVDPMVFDRLSGAIRRRQASISVDFRQAIDAATAAAFRGDAPPPEPWEPIFRSPVTLEGDSWMEEAVAEAAHAMGERIACKPRGRLSYWGGPASMKPKVQEDDAKARQLSLTTHALYRQVVRLIDAGGVTAKKRRTEKKPDDMLGFLVAQVKTIRPTKAPRKAVRTQQEDFERMISYEQSRLLSERGRWGGVGIVPYA